MSNKGKNIVPESSKPKETTRKAKYSLRNLAKDIGASASKKKKGESSSGGQRDQGRATSTRRVDEIPEHHKKNEYNIEFAGLPGSETRLQHYKQYNIMVERGVVSTRFLDVTLMTELGLDRNLKWMFAKVGLSRLWGRRYDTYIKFVIEFFSSVRVFNPWVVQASERIMEFRLDGIDRRVTAEELCNLYGFPVNGLMMEHKVIGAEFWPKVSSEKVFVSGHTKCTSMRNPVFRCFQKAIANTILARADSQNNLRTEELYFIWACFNLEEKVDICYHFMSQIANIASRKRGVIAIGGMLTPLFKHLGVDLSFKETAPGDNVLDLEIFQASGLLHKREDGIYLNDPFILLPCKYRINIKNPDNWKVGEAVDEMEVYEDVPVEDEGNAGDNGEDDADEEGEGGDAGAGQDAVRHEDPVSRVYSMRDIQKSLRDIKEEQQWTRTSIQRLSERMDTMYQWNEAIYHHFFPPPPPPPPTE